MQIATNNLTGAVILAAVSAPSQDWTLREVDGLPPGTGKIVWQDGALVRLPVPAAPVPTLTPRQLRLWLLSINITPEAIDAQIAGITDAAAQARAKVEWDYAIEYRHDHPLVIQIGTALGMNQAQIDAGFRAAATL